VLSSDDSYGSPGSYGLRHQALEELSAFTRVLRPFFGGDRGRSFSDEYYSDDMLDPDSMTYEELRALSDSVGSVNKGLSSSIITTLPTRKYSKPKNCDFGDEQYLNTHRKDSDDDLCFPDAQFVVVSLKRRS